jgi:hypothetical protein
MGRHGCRLDIRTSKAHDNEQHQHSGHDWLFLALMWWLYDDPRAGGDPRAARAQARVCTVLPG